MVAERHWIVEAEQPYNCIFEAGALRGFIEAFDGHDVTIDHTTCRRKGHPFCTYEVRWEE
jgi:predicted hydrocarbon binding protein